MKRIKKFLEMFDNEDLKSKHEIDWLSGNLNDIGKKIDVNFKDENMKKFISRLSGRNYPFFAAFDQAVRNKNGELEFSGFKVSAHYDEADKFFSFVAEDDEDMVVMSVRINAVNDYDIALINSNKHDKDDIETEEYNNINYGEVLSVIRNTYLKYLDNCGFGELTHYNHERYGEVNN